jgi:hypothetical protein
MYAIIIRNMETNQAAWYQRKGKKSYSNRHEQLRNRDDGMTSMA